MSNIEEYEYEFYENMGNHSRDDYGGSYVYDYYPEDDLLPHKYKIKAMWEVYVRGHINFLIAFATIITNLVMILVFIRRSTRSQTTVLLTSLAVSDIIICVTRIPEAVHFNINGYYNALYVTYSWCVANHVLYIIYQIFRIMSNWITALLGFQRCISVVTPFKFKTICSMRVTIVTLVVILVMAVLLNIYEMMSIQVTELKIYTTSFYNESMTSGCLRTFSEKVKATVGDENKSMMLFYIFSGLLYRIIPVVILAVTTILLAYFLRMRTLSFAPANGKKDSQKKEAQYKRITIIILAIMIVFLVAELQDGVAFIIYSIELASEQKRKILSEDADIKWDTISTTISLIGYACNFWIFFFMSKQFRSALFDMFVSRLRKIHTKVTFETGDFETASTLDRSTTASKETFGL
ncbi:hypothetical protein FSP39_012262 [Pinctada imbricata]|uniref:G-protein coupled receptors family 1 profile domain-containing protein n=1 Tax=Pinctada imbricata TaxID=66713 RepID=A0AA88YG62_PINIB|nr:hypothetical protein FSP39_012262 [Pinctada imbricata]